MNQNKRGLLFIGIFILAFICFVVIDIDRSKKQGQKDHLEALKEIGNIQFKGKVIKSQTYDFGGKNYYFICVKLDTCNVKSFYIHNDLCSLKIKNGIATMAAGFLDPYDGVVTYIEINMNNDHLEKYHYKNGDVNQFDLNLGSCNISAYDLNSCN